MPAVTVYLSDPEYRRIEKLAKADKITVPKFIAEVVRTFKEWP